MFTPVHGPKNTVSHASMGQVALYSDIIQSNTPVPLPNDHSVPESTPERQTLVDSHRQSRWIRPDSVPPPWRPDR